MKKRKMQSLLMCHIGEPEDCNDTSKQKKQLLSYICPGHIVMFLGCVYIVIMQVIS